MEFSLSVITSFVDFFKVIFNCSCSDLSTSFMEEEIEFTKSVLKTS